jgi:hypothetical protein
MVAMGIHKKWVPHLSFSLDQRNLVQRSTKEPDMVAESGFRTLQSTKSVSAIKLSEEYRRERRVHFHFRMGPLNLPLLSLQLGALERRALPSNRILLPVSKSA